MLFGFLTCAATPLLMVVFSIASQAHLLTGPGTSVLKGIVRTCGDFHYTLTNYEKEFARSLWMRVMRPRFGLRVKTDDDVHVMAG